MRKPRAIGLLFVIITILNALLLVFVQPLGSVMIMCTTMIVATMWYGIDYLTGDETND